MSWVRFTVPFVAVALALPLAGQPHQSEALVEGPSNVILLVTDDR